MPLLSHYYPKNYSEEQYNIEKRIAWHALFVSGFLIVAMWLLKLMEFEYGFDFSSWGLLPRDLSGLRGILFAPLIHGSLEHLAANTLPLFVLTFTLFFFYRKPAYTIFILIYLLTGFLVWLGGREALHIGASGIIYGLAAFLFLSGILSRNAGLLTISLIVALIYGGLFWGIFPLKPEISWESHLWGGLSGFGLAWIFRHSAPEIPIKEEEEDDPEDNEWQTMEIEQEENPEEKF
jgi:membrane associated rhomboid family serine protease